MPHRPERLAGQVLGVAYVRDRPLSTLDAQVLDVPASAERAFAGAGQDHRANILPIAETGEHLRDLQVCRTSQGINRGPVDRDLDDAVGLRNPKPGRAHAYLPIVRRISSLRRSSHRLDSGWILSTSSLRILHLPLTGHACALRRSIAGGGRRSADSTGDGTSDP